MTTNAIVLSPPRPKWLLRLFYGLLGGLIVAVLAFSVFKPLKVLPRISLAPGFVFTSHTGAHKTSDDYRGQLTIYNFTHTHCGAGCPQTSPAMQVLRDRLERIATVTPYALVTISVDPE
ncbi:MAG: SCO family protein, partial [Chloroflexi bacterium]|nr:SCO family protein [Chloroflexota bacterium]